MTDATPRYEYPTEPAPGDLGKPGLTQSARGVRGKGGIAQNADPMTGKPNQRLRADIEEAFRADAVPSAKDAPDDDYPERWIWTGGPNTPRERIVMPGNRRGIRPNTAWAYVVKSKAEYDTLKRAIGKNRMWETDIEDGEPDLVCATCQWHCRSSRAMLFHLNNAHGREQA